MAGLYNNMVSRFAANCMKALMHNDDARTIRFRQTLFLTIVTMRHGLAFNLKITSLFIDRDIMCGCSCS